jgi:hypothetical protein
MSIGDFFIAKIDLEGAKCGHCRETIDIINHPTSSPSSKPLENQSSAPEQASMYQLYGRN